MRGDLALGALRGGEHRALVRLCQRPVYRERAGLQVHVIPVQPQELALPHAGVDGQHEQGLQALAPACFEEPAGLLGRERRDLHLLGPGRLHLLAHVTWDQAIGDGLLGRLVERDVDVLDGAGREPAVQLLPIEPKERRLNGHPLL